MSQRYGGRAPGYTGSQFSKRTVLIVIAVSVVVITAAAAFFAFRPAGAPTSASNVSFEAVDSNRAVVTFNITPDDKRDSVCSVVAKNEYEAVVGYAEVTIPAQPGATSSDLIHHRVRVNTTQRSVQGHLESCWFSS